MECKKCKSEMEHHQRFWLCQTCGNTEPDIALPEVNNWLYLEDGRPIVWLKKENLDTLPYPIAHEYNRIKELLDDGQPYGALTELKDAYEVIIKFIVLAESARANQKAAKTDNELELLKILTEKPLLLNNWKVMLEKIALFNDLGPNVKWIFSKTCDLLKGTNGVDIISWRNRVIGHGALGYAHDPLIKNEFHTLLQALTKYLDDCSSLFSDFKLEIRYLNAKGEKIQKILCGDMQDILPLCLGPESFYYVSSDYVEDICLYPFVIFHNLNIYFFDSFISGKNCMDILSYSLGDKIAVKKNSALWPIGECISLLHHKLQEEFIKRSLIASLAQERSTPREDFYYGQAEKSLLESYEIKDSVKTTYIQKWLQEKLKGTKGIYLFQALSESGKTTAAMQLEGRINNAISFHETTIKVVYINDANCRVGYILDAIDSVMSCGNNGERVLRSSSKPPLIITENKAQGQQMFSTYLNEIKKQLQHIGHCSSKLLLIIDGIDELSENDQDFYDYIPETNLLEEGIHILYTSRTDDEISNEKKEKLSQISFTDILIKKTNDADIAQMHQEYIHNKLPMLTIDQVQDIIQSGDNSFLQIHLAVFMLKNNVVSQNIFKGTNPIPMAEHYLKYLAQIYTGESRKTLCTTLYLLASDMKRRDLDMISYQMGENRVTFLLIGILHDLRALLKIEHSTVNLFSINHQSTSDSILNFLSEENYIKDIENDLIDTWNEILADISYWNEEELYKQTESKEYKVALNDMLRVPEQNFYFLDMFFKHPLSKSMALWDKTLSLNKWIVILEKLFTGPSSYLWVKEWAYARELLATEMTEFIEKQLQYQEEHLGEDKPERQMIRFICMAFSDWRNWLSSIIKTNQIEQFALEDSIMNASYDIVLNFYEQSVASVEEEKRANIGQGYYCFILLLEEAVLNLLRNFIEFYSELERYTICQKYREKLCDLNENSVKRWDPVMNDYADTQIFQIYHNSARKYHIEGDRTRSKEYLEKAIIIKRKLAVYPQDEFKRLDIKKEEIWTRLVGLFPPRDALISKVDPEVYRISGHLVNNLKEQVKFLREINDNGSKDDRLSENLREIAEDINNYVLASMMTDKAGALKLSRYAYHLFEMMTRRMQEYYLLQRTNVVASYALLTHATGDKKCCDQAVRWYLQKRDQIKDLVRLRNGKISEVVERNTWILDSVAAPYENIPVNEITNKIFHEDFFEVHEQHDGKMMVRCKQNYFRQAQDVKDNACRIRVKFLKKYCNYCEFENCPAHKGHHEVDIDR